VSAEVVLLCDGAPLLSDIPGMLRAMADQIEAGEHGAVDAAFLVVPVSDAFPLLFGWGDVEGTNDPIIQLELAKTWLLNNITSRGS
jgi:hypothetical protein